MAKKLKEEQVYTELVRENYAAYVYEVQNHGLDYSDTESLRWKPTKFHLFLCEQVQKFLETDTGHPYDILLLSTPPQVGKSVTITETLPSWYLGRHPEHRVIEISYNSDFAKRFGRRNREKIKEFGDLFGIGLSPETKSVEMFELSNKRGSMLSTGVTAGVTGNPCNLMIIDDPIKNREGADSESERQKLWEEWLSSYKTRLAPKKAKVIVIQTRWHEDDLFGRLSKDPFATVMNFPMEAEENDLLGRKPGEPLVPEIGKDANWLKHFKMAMEQGDVETEGESGIRAWNALYQGRPTSAEGNMLRREWWQDYEYTDDMEFEHLLLSVDAAFKDYETSDFVVMQIWGKRGPNIYLIHQIRKHLNFQATMENIMQLKALYKVKEILVEDKANGSAIIQVLRRKIEGIIPVEPRGSKESRVNAISFAIESGNVYLPVNKKFRGQFIEECSQFPNGKHDDVVDACFAAGTKVATLFGDKNIEDIETGDRVITPFGVRKVIDCGCTGEKEVIEKFNTVVTPNHRYATKKGFAKIDTLTQAKECSKISLKEMILWNNRKQLLSMASNTDLWGQDVITCLNQPQMRGASTLKGFMSLYGNTTTGKKCLMAMKFITKMVIHSITTSAILSVYHMANIGNCTLLKTWKSRKNTLSESDRLPPNGTKAKKGTNGMFNMLKRRFKTFRANNTLALCAESSSIQGFTTQDSARITAKKSTDTSKVSDTKNGNVSFAEKNLRQKSQADTQKGAKRVHDLAERNSPHATEKIKVYNLTVEKDHLYYANGFLVANCSQALARLIWRKDKRAYHKKNKKWGYKQEKKYMMTKGDKIHVI